MTRSFRRAIVSLTGMPVGVLEEVLDGVRFTYNTGYVQPGAVPISLTLPVRAEPYIRRHLHPFFENLLPEGWLLDIALRRLHLPESDTFGLLLATCSDCIGAVEIVPDPLPPPVDPTES